MLVIDTSAFVSLAVGGMFEPTTEEFEIATTRTVCEELERTGAYDDRHGTAAASVVAQRDALTILSTDPEAFTTSRIDRGEASCVVAARELDATFLVTDDYRAFPELQELVTADVVLSPIVIRALSKRNAISDEAAQAAFDSIVADRDWLGAPIYRYAKSYFMIDVLLERAHFHCQRRILTPSSA